MKKIAIIIIAAIVIFGGINLFLSNDKHEDAAIEKQQVENYQNNGNKDFYDAAEKIKRDGTY